MIAAERSLTGLGLLVGVGPVTAVYVLAYFIKRHWRRRAEKRRWGGVYAQYQESMEHDAEGWSSFSVTDAPVSEGERLWMSVPPATPRTSLRIQRKP